MSAEEQLRTLKDFLLVYNKISDLCFNRCVKNLNYRSLTMDEEKCVDSCAAKFVYSNHRLMAAYVDRMPSVMQRRMSDIEKQNAELEAIVQPNLVHT